VPVKATRKPGRLDPLRVIEIERLRREKSMSIADAVWAVLGEDARLHYARFAGVPRPGDTTLTRKYAALISRCNSSLMIHARESASAVLAGAAEDAASKVAALATGDDEIADPHAARVRLDAGKTVLESVGIAGRGGSNVHINNVLSLGDGLRALRHGPVFDE